MKKRTSWIVNFDVPTENRVKVKENEKRNKHLDFAGELKILEHVGNGDTICNWCNR